MQHSYLIKTVIPYDPLPASYLEICHSICTVIEMLAGIDSVFSEFELAATTSAVCSYKVPSGSTNQEIGVIAEQMANDLIDNDREKIAREDNEPNPTIDYQPSIGLINSLRFTRVKNKGLAIKFTLGGNWFGIFNIAYSALDNEKTYTLEWYEQVLKCLVNHFNPTYCALLFNGMSFRTKAKGFDLPDPIGWITYASDKSEMNMPDTMQDVVIESYAEGKIMFITRDQEYTDSLSLTDKCLKALDIMKHMIRKG